MVSSISIRRRAQVWSLDLVVALVIFFGAVFIFYQFGINAATLDQHGTADIILHSKLISNHLLSAGFPGNWTVTNVTLIGLTDGTMRIQQQKIDQFAQIATADYQQTKRLLSTNRDFFITFADKDEMPLSISNVTSIGRNFTLDDPDALIKIVRFGLYNASIVQVVVHVW